MRDDINNLIEILDWSKFEGDLKPKVLDVVEQLRKFTFALRLTNKVSVAAEFAGMANYRMFFIYWFGEGSLEKLKDYVSRTNNRFAMLETFYQIAYTEDEEVVEEEEEEELFIHIPEHEEIDLFVIDKSLSFENVLQNIEVHTALALLHHSPDFESGIYWVVSYVRRNVENRQRPFLIMCRITKDKELCYIQGGWPSEYLNTYIMRNFPVDYTASLDDLRFIEIEKHTEMNRERYDYVREWVE